jgi:glutamate/tyrosine decarboxylase-like PLP-dependent enzyme
MTADIHKYGFGPKGTAVLVYRNASYRKHQFYATTHWSGGLYARCGFISTIDNYLGGESKSLTFPIPVAHP